MSQHRANIQKLLRAFTVGELLRHIAFEVEQEANHISTIGAPFQARWKFATVSVLRNAANIIERHLTPGGRA